MKSLVVYYSRAFENYFGGTKKYIEVGNTEKLAKMIGEMAGADLFKIEQERPYSKDYNTCIIEAKKDKEENKRLKLISLPKSIDEYDKIYLGYPNYWGTMPMAVYSFLDSFDFKGKTIYPFCTHEGSSLSNTIKDIENNTNGAIVKDGFEIYGSKVDYAKEKLEKWILAEK